MYLTDPKTGEKSVTLTAFVGGLVIATFKVLVSGIAFGSFTFGVFGGGDFAAMVGALGAIYAARKATDKDNA